MSKIITLLFLITILGSCKKPNIIGNWKSEINAYNKDIDSTLSINANAEDLTLLSDSTYLIKGFGSNNSTIPGWHTGGDEKGSWKGSTKERLVLFPDSYQSLIPASWKKYGRTAFKIIHLSQSELILSSLDSTKGMHIGTLMKYQRY